MKRFINLLVTMFCLMIPLSSRAEITWTTTEFDYSITNQSTFLYSQNQYFNTNNEFILKEDLTSSYDSVAETQILEYQNIPDPGSGLQIVAMSMGPEEGIDPPNGIKVRAFLNTVAQGLNDTQGADITLEAVSRIVRRFTVNRQENYSIHINLTGLVDYNSFFFSDQYQAWYGIQTEITLEQIVGTGDQIVTTTMPGFPVNLTESVSSATIEALVRPTDSNLNQITYRIKCELKLKSRIDNLTLQNYTVGGNVNGDYKLGSSESPFTILLSLTLGGADDYDHDGVPDELDNCPNNYNPDQLDEDGDEVGHECDGCPIDPLKIISGECGCGVIEDTDNDDGDDFINCKDAFPNNPNEWEDTDLDGIGNNADTDDDDDGMPDDWEIQYGLAPLINDAGEDPDQDGWSNYQEYQNGSNPNIFDSHPKKINIIPILELLLLSEDSEDPGGGEIDCSEYMINGCHIPPPSQLLASIETLLEGTYVNFSWSSANCADGYLLAIGTSSNLIDDPSTVVIPCLTTSFRANFSEAEEGSYLWAVSSRCNKYTNDAGVYSPIQQFEFP